MDEPVIDPVPETEVDPVDDRITYSDFEQISEQEDREAFLQPDEAEQIQTSAAGSFFRWLMEMLLTVGAAVLLAVFLQAYVVKTYVVPTGSMIPTIHLDDRIISNRLAYRFGEPDVGDVVVFENPLHDGPPLVKRVVAVEGQVLEIEEGWVYIDGVKQDEIWVESSRRGKDSIVEPVSVPDGHVWLMGDNRTGSSDSRVFGTVPADSIYGEAFFTYWPPDSFGVLD